MASLFDKDPAAERPLTNQERIEPEIAHLKKASSIRHGPGARARSSAPWVLTLFVCGVLWLYGMDTVFYAWNKSDAIKVYCYLRDYGSQAEINALVATKILTHDELVVLDRRTGPVEGYFPSPVAAQDKAKAIAKYLQGVQDLHDGKYDRLDFVGKVRYVLFIKWGIYVPRSWNQLNPEIEK